MFDVIIFTGHQSALGMDSPWYGILQRYLGSPRSRIRGGIVLEIAGSTRIIEILQIKDIDTFVLSFRNPGFPHCSVSEP